MRDEGIGPSRDVRTLDHEGGIRTAVNAWCRDPAAAKARYGPIASWDTSGVTQMYALFSDKADFNEDMSRWNVSNVVGTVTLFYRATSFNRDLSCWDIERVRRMDCMFYYATPFHRQLGGEWAASTAVKLCMFHRSPGTIAGKTKDAEGTIG